MRRLHRPAARPTRRAAGLAGISAAIIGLAACSSGGPTGSGSGSPTAGGGSGTSSSPSTSPSSPSSATSTSPTTPAASATSPVACGDTTAASLTVEQRVGQLLMVGIQPGSAPAGLDATIAAHHLGGAIYLGGWSGSTVVRETSAHLQAQVSAAATGGVRLLVAADQEGGQVQQLKGNGFSSIPSALVQGQSSTTSIQATGALVGRELLAAGVNVDLAPVADTVSS
ncbi:MAG: glycoside hydrolase family 3 N-terminal domain-containing protein, partial [Lapillicoccus sp.]